MFVVSQERECGDGRLIVSGRLTLYETRSLDAILMAIDEAIEDITRQRSNVRSVDVAQIITAGTLESQAAFIITIVCDA